MCASWNKNAITSANSSFVGKEPIGVFVNDQDAIYVANREDGQILVWENASSTPTIITFDSLTNPPSIFVTPDGDIYVDGDNFDNRVDKWHSHTAHSEVVMSINGSCIGLFVDVNNSLYCSSTNNHLIMKMQLNDSKSSSIVVAGTGCPGPVTNMLDHPHGVFVDREFNLYVADTDNNRIQSFAPNQEHAITMAGFGARNFLVLNRPTSVVLDADGYLFIVEKGNHRIIRSIPNGFKCLIGCTDGNGDQFNQLNYPYTMSFDTIGNIYVADFNNNRIQRFDLAIKSCGMSIFIQNE